MGRTAVPTSIRFWKKVEKDANNYGCWLWTGSCTPSGHGQITRSALEGGGTVGAHIFSYELEYGPVPKGLEIDHVCQVRNCVRPDHLEAVTRLEHVHRADTVAARNASKTHCLRGHPFIKENTYRYKGSRICRTCSGRRLDLSDWGGQIPTVEMVLARELGFTRPS